MLAACSTKVKVPSYSTSQNSKRIEKQKGDSFPGDWMGYWKGTLEIFQKNKKTRSIPMALDHQFTDSIGIYEWAIIYGEDTIKGRRDYYLETLNDSIGHFRVDEKNSIYLDTYLNDNTMISQFEVQGTVITSKYTHLGNDRIMFEILAGTDKPVSVTGNEVIDGDTIPIVNSFPINAYQRATLVKQ